MQGNQGTPEAQAPAVETADVTPQASPAEPAPEQPTVTPPPPAAEPAAGSKVASVSDYERRIAEVTAPVQEPQPGEPAAEPAPEPDTTPPAEPPADSPADPPEAPAPETQQKEFRPRLGNLPAEEKEAIALRKDLKEKGQDVPLAECLARVQAKYAPTEPEAEPPPPPRTAEAIEQELSEAETARREAIRSLDPDAQFAAEDKIRSLQREHAEISSRAQSEVAGQQARFDAEVSESHALTARVYPAYTLPNHAIHEEANRIYEALEKTGNPLVTQSDCPFRVYQMAANALGIAPADPAATTPPPPAATAPRSPTHATPKPQPVQRTAVVRPPTAGPLAPASARTTPTGPPRPAFGKIRTVADYEATVSQLA